MTNANDHATLNPYVDGTGIPDVFGGVLLFAVMDDGGVLCESCVRDVTNPVHPDNGDNDGWGIVGFDTTGNTDDGVVCDHCARVLQEEYVDDHATDNATELVAHTGTLYIGPSPDDVRAILRAANVEPFMIGDDNGRPTIELREGSVNLITSALISALVSATMERDAWKMVADSHERNASTNA